MNGFHLPAIIPLSYTLRSDERILSLLKDDHIVRSEIITGIGPIESMSKFVKLGRIACDRGGVGHRFLITLDTLC